MKNRFEAAKFETDPKFKNTIIDIKYNHIKSIASTDMSLSDITSFDDYFKQLIMKRRVEVAKIEPETTFEKTINDIKDNR